MIESYGVICANNYTISELVKQAKFPMVDISSNMSGTIKYLATFAIKRKNQTKESKLNVCTQ